jgi:haloalkane dehalogenase
VTFDIAPWRGLYPFESRYLDREGLRCHYLDEGRGEPLLLLHGNPTWSFYFRNFIIGLRDAYRLIAPDHIGCGLSDKPGDDRYGYRLEDRVRDVEALVDHLDLHEPITLVLHDWGGPIGMAFAVRRPERIGRLIIFNTAAHLLPKEKKLPWQLWLTRNTRFGAFLTRGLNAFVRGTCRVASHRGLAREVRRAYLAPYDSWRNRIAVLRFVQDIPLRPGDPSYALMREIEAGVERFADRPALICWGERDFVFDRHFLRKWRDSLPNAEICCFADAGHFVLEDAGEEIIPLARRFLERNPIKGRTA